MQQRLHHWAALGEDNHRFQSLTWSSGMLLKSMTICLVEKMGHWCYGLNGGVFSVMEWRNTLSIWLLWQRVTAMVLVEGIRHESSRHCFCLWQAIAGVNDLTQSSGPLLKSMAICLAVKGSLILWWSWGRWVPSSMDWGMHWPPGGCSRNCGGWVRVALEARFRVQSGTGPLVHSGSRQPVWKVVPMVSNGRQGSWGRVE